MTGFRPPWAGHVNRDRQATHGAAVVHGLPQRWLEGVPWTRGREQGAWRKPCDDRGAQAPSAVSALKLLDELLVCFFLIIFVILFNQPCLTTSH